LEIVLFLLGLSLEGRGVDAHLEFVVLFALTLNGVLWRPLEFVVFLEPL